MFKAPIKDSIEVLMAKPLTALVELLKYIFTGKGLFGTQVQQANLVFPAHLLGENSRILADPSLKQTDGHSPTNIPDAEIMFLPVNPTDKTFDGLAKSYGAFCYHCTVLRPESIGSVRLASLNPRDYPTSDLGTLLNANDRIPLRKALRLALAMGECMREAGYPFEDLLVPTSQSDEDLDTFMQQNVMPTYHYSSTCRMAKECDKGVVDDELRVHGVRGLRIADASIFPTIPACHLQAPVVMVAERCVNFLVNRRHA
jgi:choline dehydrogenase-like flavoprotein